MPLKNWCSIHARWSKSSLKHSIRFCGIFPSLKHNFFAYHSFEVPLCPDCIFEIHQLWQSGFSRVYSNSCCSYSFKAEIINIAQSSHNMYSNNILNFSRVSDNFKCLYKKKSEKLLKAPPIYRLHLCSGVRPPNECPGYDIKLSDCEAPNWVQIMCSIEQTVCKQMIEVKLWLLNSNTWNYSTVCKNGAWVRLRMLSIKYVWSE